MRTIVILMFIFSMGFPQSELTWVKVKFDLDTPNLQMLARAGIITTDHLSAENGWMLLRDFQRYQGEYALSELQREQREFTRLSSPPPSETDTLGQVLFTQQFSPTVESAIGLAYLSGYFYLSDFSINNEKIYQIDPDNNFQVMNIYPMPGNGSKNPWGIASNGQWLYIADGLQDIIFIADTAMTVQYSIVTPGPLATGLGYHQANLWNGDLGDFTAGIPEKMLVSDTLGNLQNSYTTNITINGVTATDSLIIESRNKFNGQVVIGHHPENFSQVFSFPSPLEFPNGLAFDGRYLWMSGIHEGGRYIVKISLGLPEPVIPTAAISLSSDSLDFGSTLLNSSSSLPLTISNPGDTTLVIDTLFTGTGNFTVSQNGNLSIPADAVDTLMLTFSPDSISSYNDFLTIVSNADSMATLQVYLSGIGINPLGIDVSAFPRTFQLHGNFPNPFNPSTEIRYYLPVPTEVSLKIFNLLGQRIKTLVSEQQAAGEQSILWEGRNSNGEWQAGGIYFYRLTVGNEFQATRKMILLK